LADDPALALADALPLSSPAFAEAFDCASAVPAPLAEASDSPTASAEATSSLTSAFAAECDARSPCRCP
jgi:hypothetical protein